MSKTKKKQVKEGRKALVLCKNDVLTRLFGCLGPADLSWLQWEDEEKGVYNERKASIQSTEIDRKNNCVVLDLLFEDGIEVRVAVAAIGLRKREICPKCKRVFYD